MAPIDLSTITLEAGAHEPGEGYCLEELVAALAGEPWSDRPQCASPVIAAYGRGLNDRLLPAERQRLLSYAARQIGSRGTAEAERQRTFLVADWAVRRFAVLGLRAQGQTADAERLATLPEIVDRETAAAAAAAADAAANAAADAAGAAADAAGARKPVIDEALALFDALLAVTP